MPRSLIVRNCFSMDGDNCRSVELTGIGDQLQRNPDIDEAHSVWVILDKSGARGLSYLE